MSLRLSKKTIVWYSDSFAATAIVKRRSNKTALQYLAVSIYHLTKQHAIDLTVKWIPREHNMEADKLSEYVEKGDWETTT